MGLNEIDRLSDGIRGAVRGIFRISIIKRTVDTGLAFIQAFGHGDPDDPTNQELLQEADIDHVQHFGFESYPTGDGNSEGVVVEADGGDVCIGERRALPTTLAAIVPGESRTYGEDGQSLLHKTGGDIEAEPKAGEHFKIGATATKAIAINEDLCPANEQMKTWMGQVEGFINGLVVGTVNPLSTTFAPTAIATVNASSTKGKAE